MQAAVRSASRAARALAAVRPGAAASRWRCASGGAGVAEEVSSHGRQRGVEEGPRLADASLLRRQAFVAGAWLPAAAGGAVVRVENPGARPSKAS